VSLQFHDDNDTKEESCVSEAIGISSENIKEDSGLRKIADTHGRRCYYRPRIETQELPKAEAQRPDATVDRPNMQRKGLAIAHMAR